MIHGVYVLPPVVVQLAQMDQDMRRNIGPRELLALLCRSFVMGIDSSVPKRSMSPLLWPSSASVQSMSPPRSSVSEDGDAVNPALITEGVFGISREDLEEVEVAFDRVLQFRQK